VPVSPDSTLPTERNGLPVWVRIGGAALLAYVIATVVAGMFLADALGEQGAREREALLESHLATLAPSTRRALAAGAHAELALDVRAAEGLPSLRVTVVLPDGAVVGESESPLPLRNHADRPEIIQALATTRGRAVHMSDTLSEPFLYLARRLDDEAGRPLGVLRVAMSEARGDAQRMSILVLLLLSALAGVPVAALVGWFAARRITRPLEEMTDTATRMAARDFASLPASRQNDELGRLARALRTMGEELSTSLEASEADRSELEAMLGSIVEGVLALDNERRVVRANRGVAEAFGLAEPPSPGTPFAQISDDADFLHVIDAALDGSRVTDADAHTTGASPRLLNVSAAPIRGVGGIGGAVVVLRDVTELRRLERARLDFVANVSHELRTPVTAVLGALETAESLGPDEADARERFIANAFRNAKRLAAIVNDLLALSAIETERARMERWPIPLLRSIRAAAGSFATEAERAGIGLTLPPNETPHVDVLAHESRLELVWVNLVGNAIKYTPSGGQVTVSVRTLPDTREAEVAVTDTGAGIPEDKLPRIFERFFRVDKARSRASGGTGLGLAIVKHIVRAHEGSVTVESHVGHGSTFRVRLPLATDADA